MATVKAVMGNLTVAERQVLTAVNSGASSLSFVGSGFIVLCYLLFKELRKFSFKLVFYLALSDLCCSFFSIIGDPSKGFFCYAQGYTTHFFCLASFLWTTTIAFTLHRTVVRHKADVEDLEPMFHLYVWGTSGVMTVIRSIANNHEHLSRLGTWCWAQTGHTGKRKYAEEIVHRAKMDNCKIMATPVDSKSKLSAMVGTPVTDPTMYRSLAGALQYLTFTRPDIAYVVQQVCLFMHAPREPHFTTLKRIIRYVKGTLDYGLHLYPSAPNSLLSYTDTDWAGCADTRRSTSGYCVFLGDNLISWFAKRQATLSRSSAEAEYRGVANVVAEICWLRNLLLELQCPLSKASLVYCDNISAIYLSHNPVQHQRIKHVEMDIHFVLEKVALRHIKVLHVPSSYQYADIFTKGLPRQLFLDFGDHAMQQEGYLEPSANRLLPSKCAVAGVSPGASQ